jgi:hypothetical protein
MVALAMAIGGATVLDDTGSLDAFLRDVVNV